MTGDNIVLLPGWVAPPTTATWSDSGSQDQGASKPFDFITANEVGDEINDDNVFAVCI